MTSRSIILIPTLNERDNLEKLIPAIFDLMPDISVLIIDDNSGDGTPELVESMSGYFANLFILNRKNARGYGRSSIDGFKWVLRNRYDFVATMDADFSHDFRVIPFMLEELKDIDAVAGSRYTRGGGVASWSFFRKVLSRFANIYVKTILNLPVADVTTGFNAYKTDVLRKLDLDGIKSEGYAFLVELKYRLLRLGCRFAEYPILFSERREGESKMSAKIIWESILLPWKLKCGGGLPSGHPHNHA